jgi:hypothetical protein
MRLVRLRSEGGYLKGERYYLTDAEGGLYYDVGWDMFKDTEWIVFVDPPRTAPGGEFVKMPYGPMTAPTLLDMLLEDMKRRGLPIPDRIEEEIEEKAD